MAASNEERPVTATTSITAKLAADRTNTIRAATVARATAEIPRVRLHWMATADDLRRKIKIGLSMVGNGSNCVICSIPT